MGSLLEKAKGRKHLRSNKVKYSQETLELTLAFLQDEIGLTQFISVLRDEGTTTATGYSYAIQILQWAIRNGDIEITLKKKS